MNVPRVIGTLISAKMATLVELQTVLGVGDAYQLIEILIVDRVNEFNARPK